MTFAECLIPKILVTLVSQGKSQQREGGHAPGYSKLLQTPSPPLPKPPIPSIGHGNFYTVNSLAPKTMAWAPNF